MPAPNRVGRTAPALPTAPAGLRAEWQRYNNIGADSVGTDDIDVFSLGGGDRP